MVAKAHLQYLPKGIQFGHSIFLSSPPTTEIVEAASRRRDAILAIPDMTNLTCRQDKDYQMIVVNLR